MNNIKLTDFSKETKRFYGPSQQVEKILNTIRGIHPKFNKQLPTVLSDQSRNLGEYEDMIGSSIGGEIYSAYYLRPINIINQ